MCYAVYAWTAKHVVVLSLCLPVINPHDFFFFNKKRELAQKMNMQKNNERSHLDRGMKERTVHRMSVLLLFKRFKMCSQSKIMTVNL